MTVLFICLIAFNRGHLSTALLVKGCAILFRARVKVDFDRAAPC